MDAVITFEREEVVSDIILRYFCSTLAFLVVQMVKNLPEMKETQVQVLGWEDPLEEEMATHSSILAWRTPCPEDFGGVQSMVLQRVGHD